MRNTGLGESVSSRKPVGEGREIVWEEELAEGPTRVPKAGEKGIEGIALSLVERARPEDVVTCLYDGGAPETSWQEQMMGLDGTNLLKYSPK